MKYVIWLEYALVDDLQTFEGPIGVTKEGYRIFSALGTGGHVDELVSLLRLFVFAFFLFLNNCDFAQKTQKKINCLCFVCFIFFHFFVCF